MISAFCCSKMFNFSDLEKINTCILNLTTSLDYLITQVREKIFLPHVFLLIHEISMDN